MIQNCKKKIIAQLENLWDWIDYGLRRLCGRPSPVKRLVAVVIIGGALSIAYIYMLASSIYNMGKQDAEKDFLELQHIETLKLQGENDSINILNPENYDCK